MTTFPLIFRDGHLFTEIDGRLWLYDTGAPESFCETEELELDSLRFQLSEDSMGLTAAKLSQLTGVECSGLIGADILGSFDHLLNVPGGAVVMSTENLNLNGETISLEAFMEIPILTVRIANRDHRMFFDTGAQISYFQEDNISDFPTAETLTDFFPGFGQFRTNTYQVEVELGKNAFTLRCGTLPGLLGATLMLAGTTGIVGNPIVTNRVVGYFPRRKLLCL